MVFSWRNFQARGKVLRRARVFQVDYLESDDPLWEAVDGVVRDEGLQLYDAERLATNGLRVSVSAEREAAQNSDPSAKQKGVSSDDCSRVCRRLMVLLSVDGTRLGMNPEPQIEVSSPGINRVLRKPSHFEGAVGERLKVVLEDEQQSKKGTILVGTLKGFADETLEFTCEKSKECMSFPLSQVRKARVDFKF